MAANDLTTLVNLKQWLNITTTTDDTLLTRLITAASSFIESYVCRDIASKSYTETRDGKGTRSLSFGDFPVTSVSFLSINGIAIVPSPSPGKPGYVFSPTQLSLIGHRFHYGFQNISFSYVAGYTTIPLDIEQAAIELCSIRYRDRDRIGQVSKTIAGEVVAFSQKDMPADVMTLLQAYKKVALG